MRILCRCGYIGKLGFASCNKIENWFTQPKVRYRMHFRSMLGLSPLISQLNGAGIVVSEYLLFSNLFWSSADALSFSPGTKITNSKDSFIKCFIMTRWKLKPKTGNKQECFYTLGSFLINERTSMMRLIVSVKIMANKIKCGSDTDDWCRNLLFKTQTQFSLCSDWDAFFHFSYN